MTQTMIHGSSDIHICAVEGLTLDGFGTVRPCIEVSALRGAAEVQITFGCQIFRKPIRQAIDTSDAPISTINVLIKLEIRNCGTAKDTPVTRIAGHTSF